MTETKTEQCQKCQKYDGGWRVEWSGSIVSKAADRSSREREQRNMVDIKSCEEIVYNLKKGSFGAMA